LVGGADGFVKKKKKLFIVERIRKRKMKRKDTWLWYGTSESM
jgi:hypothetical protein